VAHRSLEETIATIAPSRERGIPNAPTIGVGVSSDNGDLTNALSQAGQQIQQLQTAYQQQADLITQNTQALQGNTSSHGSSAGSTLGNIASSLFGGALGFLSPIISGIASLFGGSSTPAALPIYTPPPPVSINGVLQSAPASSAQTADAVPASTLSPAGQQVAQLQQSVSTQSQSNALALNTLAVTGDTANAQTANNVTNLFGGSSSTTVPQLQLSPAVRTAATVQTEGRSTDTFSGDALGYLARIASALTNPAGAGNSVSAQLPIYTPPAAVPVSGVPHPQAAATQPQNSPPASSQSGANSTQSSAAPQITVNVNAMDSQSFMDRSDDIASAVRAAMLNMHPINDVVADL
jgi:hypothetical protein